MELDHINRVALAVAEKHNLDIEDAVAKMNESSIYVIADESIKYSFSKQLAYLTTVNISHRVFLGGVKCQLPPNTPNLLKLDSSNFNVLVSRFGGINTEISPTNGDIKILFGIECFDDFCVESISSGWRGGVNFFNQKRIVFEETNSRISFGPIVSASLVCSHAFCKVFKVFDDGIDLNFGVSLWNLNSGDDWHKAENDGPEKPNLPRNIWALGLGHLGQAYLWTLGLMPFENPNQVQILLQDADIVEPENIGSQVLCSEQNIGKPKTRACMSFLEGLRFRTQIIEKLFIKGDCEQEWVRNYPFILNGVDNAETRRSINKASFKLFLDGATNGKFDLFDSFTMRNISFIQKDPEIIWPKENEEDEIFHKNLYQKYEKSHKCGILTNIGISTPFVGLFSSAIVVSELIRSLNKGKRYSIISLQMRDLTSIEAIENGIYNNDLLRFAV